MSTNEQLTELLKKIFSGRDAAEVVSALFGNRAIRYFSAGSRETRFEEGDVIFHRYSKSVNGHQKKFIDIYIADKNGTISSSTSDDAVGRTQGLTRWTGTEPTELTYKLFELLHTGDTSTGMDGVFKLLNR